MRMSIPDYQISIQRAVVVGEMVYEARVRELIQDSIRTTAEIFAEDGREMPRPFNEG